ncbi:MAG: hypothetical protein JRG92_10155 [Deltaproteobacteria bacterium]|nr:hypothetical protein [Deltaproteobacteria bacterium]
MFKQHAKWIWSSGLGLIAGVLSLHPLSQSDAYWHLMLGRAVWRTGARTVPEPAALPAFADSVNVPEWLFDLLVYAVHELAGPAGLSILIALSAAASVLALCWMLETLLREADPAAVAWVSALITTLLMARMTLRPQLAFLILLPVFVAATEKYLGAEGRPRVRLAVGLVVLQVLWAQLHGSFVLGPAVFGLMALPHAASDWTGPRRRLHLAVLAGLLLGFASSSDGIGVVHYVLVHASGDAARHVGDMPATRWENLSPISPYGVAYWLLCITALLGAGIRRGVRVKSAGLALLGVVLTLNSVRFIAVGALLLGPIALDGAQALAGRMPQFRLRGLPSTLVALALVGWSGHVTDFLRGPVGAVGLSPGGDPVAAARYLNELPPGSAVLSTFDTGASIGFWLEGRVRTYVDTRTPLHFDDTEYAVAREVWGRPESLALALDRYAVDAILTERSWATCRNAPEGWVPAVIEARHTTFVRAGDADPFVTLAACGSKYLRDDACVDDGLRLDGEIERLARWGESPFLDQLRVQRILRCGGDLALAARLLPDERSSRHMRRQRALAAALLASRSGDPERALDLLDSAVREGDPRAARIAVGTLGSGQVSRERVRDMLERAIHGLADSAPLDLRAALAMLCIQQSDAECVRFHGMRVAVAGDPDTGRVLLAWLHANHPEAAVRDDAGRWLGSLERREAETVADRMRSMPEAS